jgi:integrase
LLPHLREAFGELLLKDVTPDKVNIYLEEKLKRYSPSTCRYHLSLLKHAFNVAAKQWRILPDNPLRDVKLPVKVQNERKRYLTPQEMERLLAACSPHWKRLILTALHTGMRKNEIVSLKWEQIRLEERCLLLDETKNGEGRPVPLNGTMVALLNEVKTEQESAGIVSSFVFVNPYNGKPYRRDSDAGWYTALKRAGLSDVHFHDLRHTVASYLRMQGVDLLTLPELLGHKDGRMTKRYAHASSTYRLAAIETLDRAYLFQQPSDKMQ